MHRKQTRTFEQKLFNASLHSIKLQYEISTTLEYWHIDANNTYAMICAICPTNIFPNEKSTQFPMVIYIEWKCIYGVWGVPVLENISAAPYVIVDLSNGQRFIGYSDSAGLCLDRNAIFASFSTPQISALKFRKLKKTTFIEFWEHFDAVFDVSKKYRL